MPIILQQISTPKQFRICWSCQKNKSKLLANICITNQMKGTPKIGPWDEKPLFSDENDENNSKSSSSLRNSWSFSIWEVHFILRQKVQCSVTFQPTCYTNKIWLLLFNVHIWEMLSTVKEKYMLKTDIGEKYLFTTNLYLKKKSWKLTQTQYLKFFFSLSKEKLRLIQDSVSAL